MSAKKRFCQVCRKEIITHGYKYCPTCADDVQRRLIHESNERAKEMRANHETKEEEEFKKHYCRNFGWDNPNDPKYV